MQNFDKVLVNLEQAGITMLRAKSQFYQAKLKIMSSICDVNSCHLNTSKVLKIMDWPKYINIIFAHEFIGVCIYYQI